MSNAVASPKHAPRRIWRWVGGLACSLYAVISLVTGLDRAALVDTTRPALRNWSYAFGAGFSATADALHRNDMPAALAAGRSLLQRAPQVSRALSLYGTVQLASGQNAAARKTFALAAELGWRDPITQRYWFDAAMRAGDVSLASRRLDALLRQKSDLPDRDALLRQILAFNEGRSAIAERLRADPEWADVFVSQTTGLDLDDLAARADVVQRVGRGHWPCSQAASLINALLANGLPDEARIVHSRACNANGAIVNDGDFNEFAAGNGASALDWASVKNGGLIASINRETDNTHLLALTSTTSSTLMALKQQTTAGPGRYLLEWRMPDTTPADADGLVISFDCDYDQARALNGTLVDSKSSRYAAEFEVPEGCPYPVLRFWLRPNHPVQIAGVRMWAINW